MAHSKATLVGGSNKNPLHHHQSQLKKLISIANFKHHKLANKEKTQQNIIETNNGLQTLDGLKIENSS
jgi:hypothetical protein